MGINKKYSINKKINYFKRYTKQNVPATKMA